MGCKKVNAAAAAIALGLVLASPFVRADIAGFGDGSGFQINNNASGAASISGGTLNLTTGVNSQASSAFNTTPQSIGNFTASFTYTDVNTGGADGFAFVLQNDPRGAGALGDSGGALGYASGTTPITPSAAMTFNIFANNGGSQAGFGGNGAVRFLPTGTVNITNGQPVNVTVNYAPLSGSVGVVSGTLNQGGNNYSVRPQLVKLTTLAGGGTAYVGFTGGTGGINATQTLSNFAFTSGTGTKPTSYNVLQTTDAITQVNGTQFPNGNNGTFTPAAEGVANSIDKGDNSKYLNFGGAGSGFSVTPAIGSTIVTSLVLTSANDSPNRDPGSYLVRGSNDGTNYVDIASGAVPAFAARFSEQEFSFANSTAYTSYQVVFPTVADSTTNNSMQIGEVQLIGSAVPEPTVLGLIGLGVLPALGRRRRPRA